MARYSGLSAKVILQHNLDVPVDFFWKEFLRDKGFTVGRLDSRYRGIDREDAGEDLISMRSLLPGCILSRLPLICISGMNWIIKRI